MSDLLWQKPGVKIDERIQRFLAGDDVILDREFFLFDIEASRAHAEGLLRIGILAAGEFAGIQVELTTLAEDFRNGDFALDERFEDCHSAIESRLIERLGDAGRKIHTGRSRNDQILVATRLWLKDRLARLHGLCIETAEVALARAEAEASVPLPGYTHLQRAVVSSLKLPLAVRRSTVPARTTGWPGVRPKKATSAAKVVLASDVRNIATASGHRTREFMDFTPLIACSACGDAL